ncbi:hypothetical protein ABGB14_26340 [Nonomuraea sp. B10E15]|uniref:hypothetical protein n=1 Tax=Nonomuraea sp. B10E15 TaxID=3153560 RepID=UPI00325F52A4
MRGQEPGSEHDRREADNSAAPATPPPSFGQTDGRDVPPAFTPSGTPSGTPSDTTTGIPYGGAPYGTPSTGAASGEAAATRARPAIPVFQGPPPDLPAPDDRPGAQPWEVSGDDTAPYDWFADHTGVDPADQEWGDHPHAHQAFPGRPSAARELLSGPRTAREQADPARPGHTTARRSPAERMQSAHEQDAQGRGPQAQDPPAWDAPEETGRWPAKPVVPSAPPWEPPPAFTAAAAGMPVWPAPAGDPHAMPPWPAATGELVADPDPDEPGPLPASFDPNATDPEGFTRPADAGHPETDQAEVPRPGADRPEAPRATTPGPVEAGDPGTTPSGTAQPAGDADVAEPPGTAKPRTGDASGEPPLSAPVAAERDDTRPIAHNDVARPVGQEVTKSKKPAHYFDPKAARRDAARQERASEPGDPSARAPEPGDVPVWPPLPPEEEKLPDLPFPRDTWGQRQPVSLDAPTPPVGSPAFPAGAFKQPPFQAPPPPPAPPGRSRRALLVTLGALALAGVATGGFFAWQAVSDPAPTTAAARPSASVQPSSEPAASPPAEGASALDSERTDPQKLSLSEAFPDKKVSAAGATFTRVKAGIETACDKAAMGAFADALKEQKCSRVLRATYVDRKRRYAVTTGIAVLPDKTAAEAVDQAKNLSRNVWFRPLPGGEGSGGERVHVAGGYAAGLVWGRYLVFSYATHADGHTPSAGERTLPKVSGAFRDETSLVLERRVNGG